MKPVKIGLLGLGTVGGGTVNVLQRNSEEIARRAGRPIEVVHAAVRSLGRERICDTQGILLTEDPFEVVRNPELDLVVELIGGCGLAKELVLEAISLGKHVVTANKALIAECGNEIFAAAEKKGVSIFYEAGVAGGIPIIKALREGLSANRIEWLAGIINGTGNFILSEMRDKGREFSDVLKEAQELGYAEADPTFDVEGIDAAHKLTILASIAYGIPLKFDKVYTEGISKITPQDVIYAGELGYVIKHLGIARRSQAGIEMRVHPTLVPASNMLGKVDGVMNAVMVNGDAVGNTFYYGPGAGAEPTASAVLADVIDLVRSLEGLAAHRVAHTGFAADQLGEDNLLSIDQISSAYYLRIEVLDRAGVMASVASILGELDISIEAIIQKEPREGETRIPLILLTHVVEEQRLNQAIERIEALKPVSGSVVRIRMDHLD
ncbi:homoserine dehydrogenase [Pelagibaculum spongiae]|uniref:Homoserine dehydrogenase n=1 Tax=Pelagibaculum spongiae TaxID=2080658 RepID=A0A2V1GR06_9GAMM|nr:homoserine dehydrogenase [Pelagibaculum spongiae]PVZ62999.1 homoserine dehydrogenase [Pelagibaculum spongiae]